jgi:ATP-dependent DNA helicase RecG
VEKTVEKILNIITDNPQITQTELAEMTGLTRRGIEWNLAKLKSKGLIQRIGADKGGCWEVTSEGESGEG